MAEGMIMLHCLNITFAWFIDANNCICEVLCFVHISCLGKFVFWSHKILRSHDIFSCACFKLTKKSRKFCRNPFSKHCLPILCPKWVRNLVNHNCMYYTTLTHSASAVNPTCWRRAYVAYIMPGARICSIPNPFHIYIVEILPCQSGKNFR